MELKKVSIEELKTNINIHETIYLKLLWNLYDETKEEKLLIKIKSIEQFCDNEDRRFDSIFEEYSSLLKFDYFENIKKPLKEILKSSVHHSTSTSSKETLSTIKKLKKFKNHLK